MIFRARQFKFTFPRPALVMGVVNVTPDSFSDGGKYFGANSAVEHALRLVAEGADLLDIGGESTRPHATPVSEAEELRRVLPVIEALAPRVAVPLSIDTLKPAVARAALQAGASLVNDVGANRDDDAMGRVVAAAGAGYVLMHMQGTPATMQKNPIYQNVVGEVGAFFTERLARLRAAGVDMEQIVLDPGIGFGKSLEHNLQLLAGLNQFTKWGHPLLIGVSRKSFLGGIGGGEAGGRLPGSLAGACWAVAQGAQIIRAHDVAATVQAVRVTGAILKTSCSKS
ncbi:MAG: dihydropteroate synthase [Pedosphaera sp.]|nr:dihydropteroate synthase [Pedosphaera sp.]